ncbi:hypothetical protein CYMTET_23019 [Cymbomonas tetramitiformis]|uniref:Cilia- and flagella-associated protein 61 N-terminal domain-containing protein n=1 Tax=Cymbomonas tetramitiformis TaxID=36881 RepID=A0AAE0FYN5_9CHLO|nr:hypothetical protein CYMTET_23019 [Cymbomonas tetramitiformis]
MEFHRPVVVRPSATYEQGAIEQLFLENDENTAIFGKISVGNLIENAVLSLTASCTQTGALVGYIALLTGPAKVAPKGVDVDAAQKWLSTEAAKCGHEAARTLWVKTLFVKKGFETTAPKALLQGAFTAKIDVSCIFLSGPEVVEAQPNFSSLYTTVGLSMEYQLGLYECRRQKIRPPLLVRRACVEDHDDLVPVLQRAAARSSALTSLPPFTAPEEDFALARLISAQDDAHCVLVAEDEGKLVGVMALSSDINVKQLQKAFELDMFDNLMEVSGEEEEVPVDFDDDGKEPEPEPEAPPEPAEVEEGGEPKEGEEVPAEGAEAADAPPAEGAAEPSAVEGEVPPPVEGEEGAAPVATEGEEAGEEVPAPVEEPEPEPEPEPEEDENAIVPSVAFAISMFCLDPQYDTESMDFLEPAFNAYADKDYCLLTLPHQAHEPYLLRQFTRVMPRSDTSFPEVLYLTHRAGLIADYKVLLATESHLDEVRSLLVAQENRKTLYNDFLEGLGSSSMVICCQGQVIGMTIVEKDVDLSYLGSNFELESCIALQYHGVDTFALLKYFVLNPIFNHHRRLFLMELMRLKGASVLILKVQQPHDMVPEVVLPDFFQVPSWHLTDMGGNHVRRRRHHMEADSVTGLRWFSGINKVTTRVPSPPAEWPCGSRTAQWSSLRTVFTFRDGAETGSAGQAHRECAHRGGGSLETGLACLSLLQVTIVDERMVELDREAHEIVLESGRRLPYEVLLLTTGLQDQTRYRLGIEVNDPVPVYNLLEILNSLTEEEASGLEGIIVYGSSFEAMQCLQTLGQRGVPSEAVSHIMPPTEMQAAQVVKKGLEKAYDMEQVFDMAQFSQMRLMRVDFDEQGATAVFDKEGQTVSVGADIVITCDAPDVDPDIFRSLNSNSIVYDGRLVVDNEFRTNDPDIYGAGSLCKFSRKFGKCPNMEYFNALEVGRQLASSIVTRFSGNVGEDHLPILILPKAVGGVIPGKINAFYLALPHVFAKACFGDLPGGKSYSRSKEGYFCLQVDKGGIIAGLVYCGKRPVNIHKMSLLMGLPAEFLDLNKNFPQRTAALCLKPVHPCPPSCASHISITKPTRKTTPLLPEPHWAT